MTPGNFVAQAAVYYGLKAANDPETEWERRHPECSVRKWLRVAMRAPKFLLPEDGALLERSISYIHATSRLPFPETCVEFAHSAAKQAAIRESAPPDCLWSARSVVVAKEHEDFSGFDLFGFSFMLPAKIWVLTIPDKMPFYHSYAMVKNLAENPGCFDDVLFPDVGQSIAAPHLSLMQALQCSNVTTEIIAAPLKFNSRRVAAGRCPFFDYRILTLKPSPRCAASDRAHASPRQHLRRGHIRRLHDGRTLWVNQTVVGAVANGIVRKDYRLLGVL